MTIQWFSLQAPQHPKKATMKTMTPTTIKIMGGELVSIISLYCETLACIIAPTVIIATPDN